MKDVRSGLRASLAMAVCALLLAPAAAADNGKDPREEHPGNSASAPGQEKKNEPAVVPDSASPAPPPPAPPPPPPPPPPPAPAPEPAQATVPATSPASTQQPTPSERPPGSHGSDKPKPPRPAAQPPPAASGSAGEQPRESTAHDKVLICHATGSATNPYVVISISVNAWSRGSGHGAHSGDVFIDWSWPGDPRQKDESLCPSRAPETPTTTTTSNETPAAPEAPTGVPTATTPAPAAGEAVPAVASPAATAGPRSESAEPASWSRTVRPSGPAGGVLATTSRLSRVAVRGTLPFTGMPLWGVALAGLGLIGLGIPLVRRSGRANPAR